MFGWSVLGNCKNMVEQHEGLCGREQATSEDEEGHSTVTKTQWFLFWADNTKGKQNNWNNPPSLSILNSISDPKTYTQDLYVLASASSFSRDILVCVESPVWLLLRLEAELNSKAAQKQPHARNFSSVQTGKSQKQENRPTRKRTQKRKSRKIQSLGNQVRVQTDKTGQGENRTQRRENSTEMVHTEICGGWGEGWHL